MDIKDKVLQRNIPKFKTADALLRLFCKTAVHALCVNKGQDKDLKSVSELVKKINLQKRKSPKKFEKRMSKYVSLIFEEHALAYKPTNVVNRLKADMVKDLAQQIRSFKQAHKGEFPLLLVKCKGLIEFMKEAGAWDDEQYK